MPGRRRGRDRYPDSEAGTVIPPSTGAIGVVDARTLTRQYYVKLDDGALRKAMSAELSPNGKLLWTQGGEGTERGDPGRDLLAFRWPRSSRFRGSGAEAGAKGDPP